MAKKSVELYLYIHKDGRRHSEYCLWHHKKALALGVELVVGPLGKTLVPTVDGWV